MKFQVGDRVRVYGYGYNSATANWDGRIGTVKDVSVNRGESILLVTVDGEEVIRGVHPKQCRKLKKSNLSREHLKASIEFLQAQVKLFGEQKQEIIDVVRDVCGFNSGFLGKRDLQELLGKYDLNREEDCSPCHERCKHREEV